MATTPARLIVIGLTATALVGYASPAGAKVRIDGPGVATTAKVPRTALSGLEIGPLLAVAKPIPHSPSHSLSRPIR
jgi:hypothetical protein